MGSLIQDEAAVDPLRPSVGTSAPEPVFLHLSGIGPNHHDFPIPPLLSFFILPSLPLFLGKGQLAAHHSRENEQPFFGHISRQHRENELLFSSPLGRMSSPLQFISWGEPAAHWGEWAAHHQFYGTTFYGWPYICVSFPLHTLQFHHFLTKEQQCSPNIAILSPQSNTSVRIRCFHYRISAWNHQWIMARGLRLPIMIS